MDLVEADMLKDVVMVSILDQPSSHHVNIHPLKPIRVRQLLGDIASVYINSNHNACSSVWLNSHASSFDIQFHHSIPFSNPGGVFFVTAGAVHSSGGSFGSPGSLSHWQ